MTTNAGYHNSFTHMQGHLSQWSYGRVTTLTPVIFAHALFKKGTHRFPSLIAGNLGTSTGTFLMLAAANGTTTLPPQAQLGPNFSQLVSGYMVSVINNRNDDETPSTYRISV